jgi:hypothetical protein
LWLLAPYLDLDELRAAWRRSLERAGVPSELLKTLVLDIKLVSGDVSRELQKYLTKDIIATGDDGQPVYAPPGLFAELYQMIDGRHLRESSKGFSKLAPISKCGDCGAARYVKDWRFPPPALFEVELELLPATGPPPDTS